MPRALVLILLATSAVVAAPSDGAREAAPAGAAAAAPAQRPPGPGDAKAIALLEQIATRPDKAARTAAIADLAKAAPGAIDAIGAWLVRPHTTTEEDRRAVLAAIEAAVPDAKGRFVTPQRQTGQQQKADDELDWLPKLLELDPAMPGVGEVIADVAAIRALSGTKDIQAAYPLFEAAFHAETMIYRDECGRYLRKMEPYAIPALTKASAGRGDRKRYATFQLERLDRQEPLKALAAAAGDEALTIAILDVFRETRLREAVHATWTQVSADAPRVRAAARAAWMAYITGRAPPPAPKKKLQLPGGKLTKEEKPLWLTYRELADNELRQASNDLLGTDYTLEDPMSLDDNEKRIKVEKIDLEELTQRLFAYFDGKRAEQETAQWAAAKATADRGDLEAAATMLDRLIAANPERGERDGMAQIYFAWAKQLEGKQRWADAAAAYSKAHGLDPKGKHAKDALAAHHFTLGKSLEAEGKDGGADFRRAIALKPDYAPAEEAVERIETGGRPIWMLYAAFAAAALAAGLFAAGLMHRRAS